MVDVFLASIEADEARLAVSFALPTCRDYPLQVQKHTPRATGAKQPSRCIP